jgi:3'-phosphoadenosine 5'-phosphosulfate sulfotransferase (PAPS reductase)/FAD synthetase
MALTVLSFGGGQDSTTILYKFIYDRDFRAKYAPDELVVVMSDTGNEHPETNAHVAKCRDLCMGFGIPFEFLSFDRGFHSGSWANGLQKFFETNDTIGSVAFPATCSVNLKVEPIRRWLKEYCALQIGRPSMREDWRAVEAYRWRTGGKIKMLLGIAADEDRVQAPSTTKWVAANIENVYPLRDLGWNRADCQRYIASVGRTVPPPSNCIMCHFKSPQELLWTARTMPREWSVWVALEARKLAANTHMNAVVSAKTGRIVNKNLGVKNQDTLVAALAKAEAQYGHMTLAELDDYRMSHGHCTKTSF